MGRVEVLARRGDGRMINDDDGANKRRRIRIDDEDDDEVGSNPDEMLNDQPDVESEEEGEDLQETWKE